MKYSSQPSQRWLLVAALGLALAAACRAASPPATATPEVLADCFWSAQAFAWVDTDGNGQREAGEPPLAGVAVNFSLTFYSGATTDAEGVAHVSGMHPGACDPALANSLVATAPDGYAPTTDLVVAYTEAQAEYPFGFQPNP